MPRYKLRTLLIVLALGPVVLWMAWLIWDYLAHPGFFVPEFIDYHDGRGPQPIKP